MPLNLTAISRDKSHESRDLTANPATSDEVLIGRIANGDRLAMQVLFARHHVRVYRFVLRLVREEATAEDLISEVFLDVWRQAGRFEGRSQVSTWLLAIARFKALSVLRRKPEQELDEEMAELRQQLDLRLTDLRLRDEDGELPLRASLVALGPHRHALLLLLHHHLQRLQAAVDLAIAATAPVGRPAASAASSVLSMR